MSLLSDRDVTDEERAAIADEPRPGVWVQQLHNPANGSAGDARALTQDETEQLIEFELSCSGTSESEHEEIRSLLPRRTMLGGSSSIVFDERDPGGSCAVQQRGGIHSDPLVRLLAFRAWGDRDRAWRKRDTARVVIDQATMDKSAVERCREVYGFDGILRFDEAGGMRFIAQCGNWQATAVRTEESHRSALRRTRDDSTRDALIDWYLDLFDELDAKLAAGGEPLPSGPLTFDVTASR